MMSNIIRIISIITTIFCFSINIAGANNRIIIKYKSDNEEHIYKNQYLSQKINPINKLNSSQINMIQNSAGGITVKEINSLATGAHVIKFNKELSSTELQKVLNKLQQDKKIEYAVEDILLHPTYAVNPDQWDMELNDIVASTATIGANFVNSWTIESQPGLGVVVAVIDTGYTPHPNFISNLQSLPNNSESYGYQFISDCRIAGSCPSSQTTNTDLNPKADGLDLGDYLTSAEISSSNGFFSSCSVMNSSTWHGTHVTGIINAQGYNANTGLGILGGAYYSKVLPIRVLGKCGGYTSDIINAILWSTGFNVSNTNLNTTPAKVINLSLGAISSCSQPMQDAINKAISTGAIIVVAAGNEHTNVKLSTPANCRNVVSVSANSYTGSLAWYSNYGDTTVTAPGGDYRAYITPLGPYGATYSTVWKSSQAYNYVDGGSYNYYQGTSQATPHVTALIANIISIFKNRNQNYNPALVMDIIKSTSTGVGSANCVTYSGSMGCTYNGYINAAAAIESVMNQSNIMTPIPSTITFASTTNRVATITFNNATESSWQIESTIVSAGSSTAANIVSNSCYNSTLNTGQSCSISIDWQDSSASASNVIFLTGYQNLTTLNNQNLSESNTTQILSYVTISNAYESSTTPTSSSGGGGCSIIQNGNDKSILILLVTIIVIGLSRKYYNNSKTDD